MKAPSVNYNGGGSNGGRRKSACGIDRAHEADMVAVGILDDGVAGVRNVSRGGWRLP